MRFSMLINRMVQMMALFGILTISQSALAQSTGDYDAGVAAYNRQDYTTALTRFRPACDAGNAAACTFVGVQYERGYAVSVSLETANAYYRRGCDGGNKEGCTNIGVNAYLAKGMATDYGLSLRSYTKGCNFGAMGSCSGLGNLYENGYAVPKDLVAAKNLYSQACTGNDSSGCQNMGRFYDEGIVVGTDLRTAQTYYKKACDLGLQVGCDKSSSVTARLGSGTTSVASTSQQAGVKIAADYDAGVAAYNRQDYTTALNRFRPACNGGKGAACTFIGVQYEKALGVAQSFTTANDLYRRGCDLGNVEGCSNIGVNYLVGNGTPINYQQAFTFFTKGCNGGSMAACSGLGNLYEAGNAVPKDLVAARGYYLRACEAGIYSGCQNMGRFYDEGIGVSISLTTAQTYYKKSCDLGFAQGCQKSASVTARLSSPVDSPAPRPVQVVEAKPKPEVQPAPPMQGPGASQTAQRKVALIIGISNYPGKNYLSNPVNDAKLVAAGFRQAGFQEVVIKLDLNLAGFQQALREFRQKAFNADVAAVYYAGHGMERQGDNFLLPLDASLSAPEDLSFEAINLNSVLDSVKGAKLRMIILDACRDNPFGRGWTGGTRSRSAGLAAVDVDDVMVIYAAAAGQQAADGTGANSPFATALASRLPQPGVAVQLLGYKIRDDVLKATGGAQRPYVNASITGEEIYLVPPAR